MEQTPAKILVVDDDPRARDLVSRYLASKYSVLQAEDVPSALKVVEEHGRELDAVLLDVMLPGVSGFDGCRAIKAAMPTYLPILLLTALGEQDDRNTGLAAGADDFLTKPVNRKELELRVATFVKLRQQDALIRSQLAELRELSALKDDLVHLLVHDLRGPLAALTSAFHLLKSSTLDEEQRADVQLGMDSSKRLGELISDLLQVRLLEEGKLPLVLEQCRALAVVTEAVDSVRPVADERRVQIVFSPTADDLVVTLDRKLVRRAIENLLSNAVKYTRQRVEISLTRHDTGAEIVVSDMGPGVPDAQKPVLFQKFGSVEASQGNQRRGIGLGLYLVRLVAAAHWGNVVVEDRQGGGSRFCLRLGAPSVS